MTPADLAAIKSRLYLEAVDAGKIRSAFFVARALGSSLGQPGLYGLHSGPLTFTLYEGGRWPYVVVRYKGIPVLCTEPGNWLFLPGPWESLLADLAVRARQIQERAEAVRERDALDELLRSNSD